MNSYSLNNEAGTMANKALVYAIYPNENRNEQEQNKSKILLDKIFRFYYNKKHDVCPHRADALYHLYL